MNIRHAIITLSFLKRLEKKANNECLEKPIRKGFETLLQHEELISILQHMYGGEAETEYPNFQEKSKQELLEIIHDEYYILSWLIEEVLGSYTL